MKKKNNKFGNFNSLKYDVNSILGIFFLLEWAIGLFKYRIEKEHCFFSD